MKIKSLHLFFLGIILCIPLTWNYLQPHFFHLHDFTHVSRLYELEQGLLSGQFPVRWSENLGYGYGMPQFSFYAPLFYYQALIFRAFGISFLWSIKLTVILQVLLSFWGLYKIGERIWDKWAGLLVGIAGIYAPYRLVDMYVRGAFGELSGITFFTLTLYAILAWSKKPTRKNMVFVIVCGAGIILSHNLMALIAAPFVMAWILYWSVKEKRLKKYWLDIGLMGALTVGLSAYYAVPALLEKSLTQAEKLTTGFSNYNHHFLYIRQFWNSHWGYGGSIWGIDDDVTFQLGKVQIVIIGLAFLLYVYKRVVLKKSIKNAGMLILTMCMLGIALFLTILKSKFVWDFIPMLAYIQFPWRYLSVSLIFVAILTGSVYLLTPKRWRSQVVFILIVGIIISQIGFARPESFLENDDILYYTDETRIKTEMSDVIPDFLPIGAHPENLPALLDRNAKFTFLTDATYEIKIDRGYEFLLAYTSTVDNQLTIGIFDFPGWSIYIDGEKTAHTTNKDGLIQIDLPQSDTVRFVSGRFEETPVRLWSDIVSLVSLVMIGSLLWKPMK